MFSLLHILSFTRRMTPEINRPVHRMNPKTRAPEGSLKSTDSLIIKTANFIKKPANFIKKRLPLARLTLKPGVHLSKIGHRDIIIAK